jgi:hypothetical protein
MRTVEELEALLETVTRERDMSLAAWESAGMTGRTAQSAMLELARQLEDARAELTRERIGIRPIDEVRCDAYRRGAQAMREACAARLIAASIDRPGHAITREHAAEMLLRMPIPEEP